VDEWVRLDQTAWRMAGDAERPEHPRGEDAVGWLIGIYWPEDTIFYQGQVLEYSPERDEHYLRYDDGECEWLNLGTERVKWAKKSAMSAQQKAQYMVKAEDISADAPLAELRKKFYQLFGRRTTSNNKWWLLRKLNERLGTPFDQPDPHRPAPAAPKAHDAGRYRPTPLEKQVTDFAKLTRINFVFNEAEADPEADGSDLEADGSDLEEGAPPKPAREGKKRTDLLERLMKLNTICTYVDSCEQLAKEFADSAQAPPANLFDLGSPRALARNLSGSGRSLLDPFRF